MTCAMRECLTPADRKWVSKSDKARVLWFCWAHEMMALLSQYADRWEREQPQMEESKMSEGKEGRFCAKHEMWNPSGECPYCEPAAEKSATIYVSDWQLIPRLMGVPLKVDPNMKGSDWEYRPPAPPTLLDVARELNKRNEENARPHIEALEKSNPFLVDAPYKEPRDLCVFCGAPMHVNQGHACQNRPKPMTATEVMARREEMILAMRQGLTSDEQRLLTAYRAAVAAGRSELRWCLRGRGWI